MPGTEADSVKSVIPYAGREKKNWDIAYQSGRYNTDCAHELWPLISYIQVGYFSHFI